MFLTSFFLILKVYLSGIPDHVFHHPDLGLIHALRLVLLLVQADLLLGWLLQSPLLMFGNVLEAMLPAEFG